MSRDIGKKIAELRKLLGDTQEIFGERLGVEQATVSRWEKGEPPQRRYEKPIADLAHMTVAEFFHSAEKPRLIPIIGDLSDRGVALRPTKSGGAIGHITLSLGENDQIALTVVGNALAPAYRHGDTIIAGKLIKAKMAKAVGRDCIVLSTSGDAYIKNVRKGSRKGAYNLRDVGLTSSDDLEDVELQWAAPIIWIGRAQ
jgi:transcriptional regulator with XRE-family HTH domain